MSSRETETTSARRLRARSVARWAGLIAGPLAALAVYHLLPATYLDTASGETLALTSAARATMAAMAWMAVWWLSEAVEIAVAALLPIALFPVLGIAYAASIGGLATIIGTPPNVFLVGFLREHQGIDVTFLGWLRVGVPLVVVMLPLAWLLLTCWIYSVGRAPIPGVAATLRGALADLGPLSRGERITLTVAILTALAWITRPLLVA